MANKIILNQQTFSLKEILEQIPGNAMKKKIYFQAELQSLENGDAKFGIIAYPAWRDRGKWELGYKITGSESGAGTTLQFADTLGLANNELVLSPGKKKKKGKKKKNKNKKFYKLFGKISCDPKLAEKAVFHCKTSISENPHLEYEVTLEAGGESARARTNPSPPDNPAY